MISQLRTSPLRRKRSVGKGANGSGPKSGHPIALARWGPRAGPMTGSAPGPRVVRSALASAWALLRSAHPTKYSITPAFDKTPARR